MKKLFATAVIVAATTLSTSAFAFHCPVDMKKIDAAMAANYSLSTSQMAKIKGLRIKGEAFHKSGKHKESVDTLAKAMDALGIN